MKSNTITTLTSGLIRRNFLEDFPQHLTMDVNTDYRLIISSSNLTLVYELYASDTSKCEVRIPFKIYNTSHIVIDWGDRNYKNI